MFPQCPFHGRIIPRDEEGQPVNTSADSAACPPPLGGGGAEEGGEGEGEHGPPLWEDPELQRDIMAATGADLGGPSKEKKKGGRKGLEFDEQRQPKQL